MMQVQDELNTLNIKQTLSNYYPNMYAFVNYGTSAQRDEFNFLADKPWYTTNLWGVTLSVPIWTSGQNSALRSQAKISLEQSKNDLTQLEKGLKFQHITAKSNYNDAQDNYENSKQAVVISKDIYQKNQIKFKEGIISSLTLSQVQTQYLSSETQKISAMYNLIMAKIALDKISNKL